MSSTIVDPRRALFEMVSQESSQEKAVTSSQPQSRRSLFENVASEMNSEATRIKSPTLAQYAVPEKTPEELRNMSVMERLQHAQELGREREVRQSMGLTKGALSGATLGLSEAIPGLEKTGEEYGFGAGEVAGSILPMQKIYSIFGKPLVKLASKSPYAQKSLTSVAKLVGAPFISGAVYETGKEIGKSAKEGKLEISPEDIIEHGITWVVIDSALAALGLSGKFAKQILNKSKESGESTGKILVDVAKDIEKSGLEPGNSAIGDMAISSLEKISKKPSGLTVRQFEKLKKPINVTPERFEKIVNTVEKESRDIAENILKTNKTRIAMKEFPDFKQRLDQAFEKVDELAKELPHKYEGSNIVREYHKKAQETIDKGFREAAAEKAYKKEMKYLIKKHVGKDYDTHSLVKDVYRYNNKTLTGLYEKAASSNVNEAKKQAVLDFQQVVANQFEKTLPGTQFTNLFKFTNKVFSDRMKILEIESYLDKVFTGNKINFKEARKYFEQNKVRDAVKSVYGKESADAFTNLQKDLLSYEEGMKLIKASEKAHVGLGDYAHLLIPNIGPINVGSVKIGKKYLMRAMDTLLDKPQVMMKWDQALKDVRLGRFQIAARKLQEVSEEINNAPQTHQ